METRRQSLRGARSLPLKARTSEAISSNRSLDLRIANQRMSFPRTFQIHRQTLHWRDLKFDLHLEICNPVKYEAGLRGLGSLRVLSGFER